MKPKIKTTCVQIGNSDNKLTQTEWKDYCNHVHKSIESWKIQIHFSAPSVGWADWQNAAWIFTVDIQHIDMLKEELSEIAKNFKQDSIAWFVGDTEFINAHL